MLICCIKKNLLVAFSVVPNMLPFFFFSLLVPFAIKKKYTFQSHFHFLPLFSLVPRLPSPFKKKLLFKTLTSFLFSSPSCLPFFPTLFAFFQLHRFPAPFQHTFHCLHFF